MAREVNLDDPRTFLYLKNNFKAKLAKYTDSDPRFKTVSACATHLLKLGFKHDKKDREKAVNKIK